MLEDSSFVERLHEWIEILRRTLMGNVFGFARDNGLTMPQFGTMFRLYHTGACGVSDVGNSLGVTNSAASQMLERLVQLKLITRSEDPKDRRVKQIVLTDKGRQIIEQTTHAYHSWMEDLASSMTEEEKEQVDRGLAVLIEKAHQIKMSTN